MARKQKTRKEIATLSSRSPGSLPPMGAEWGFDKWLRRFAEWTLTSHFDRGFKPVAMIRIWTSGGLVVWPAERDDVCPGHLPKSPLFILLTLYFLL